MSLVEGKHPGEYVIDEVSCDLSREKVTIGSGNNVDGTVLGMKTADKTYHPLTPGASDGTQNAAAILRGSADASSASVDAIATTRLTAVRDSNLTWPAGITEPQKEAAIAKLAEKHIIVK